MRSILHAALFVAALTTVTAQVTELRFIFDAPGPGYRSMAGTDKHQIDPAFSPEAILTFQPKDISSATLKPADNGMSQIQLSFRLESAAQIKEYIEFNKEKPIRVEVGDYTLPIDIKKTLPWTTGVWLEKRPNDKAKTILETIQKQK